MYGVFAPDRGNGSVSPEELSRRGERLFARARARASAKAGEPLRIDERGLAMAAGPVGPAVFGNNAGGRGRDVDQGLAIAFAGFLLNVSGSPAPWQAGEARGVVAEQYGLYGPDCVSRLDGAFIFAVYDFARDSLMLARDSLGEKNLYYSVTDLNGGSGGSPSIAFAAESSALLDAGFADRQVDELSLLKYLTFGFVPDENTMVRGIQKLMPGEYLLLDRRGLKKERYWRPRENGELVSVAVAEGRLREYTGEARSILESAVDSRLAFYDSPGVFLSGGLDSSLVAALAAKRRPGMPTFSISFGDEYAGESFYSNLVARHCGTTHRVLEIKPSDFLRELPAIIGELDDPIGDAITVPNYLLGRFASDYTDAIFNGEGGDPLFGGPKNIPLLLSALFEANGERRYLQSYRKMYEDLPELMAGGFSSAQDESLRAIPRPFLDDDETHSYLNKLMGLNTVLKGGCNILMKVSRTYSRNGLTPLSPLFDRRLTDFAFRVPPALKLHGRVEKFVLKHAVQDLLPEQVVWREKSGMMVPVYHWFQDELRPFAQEVLAPRELDRHGFFDPAFVSRILNYDLPERILPGFGSKLWMLLSFQLWYRAVIDGS